MNLKNMPMPDRFQGYARLQVDREELNPSLTLIQRNLISWCLRQGRFTVGQTEIDLQVAAEMAYQIHQCTGNRVVILTDSKESAVAVVAAADQLDISVGLSTEPKQLRQTGVKVIESSEAAALLELLGEGMFDAAIFVGARSLALPIEITAAIDENCPIIGIMGTLRAPGYALFELYGSQVGALLPARLAEAWIH